MSNTNIDSMQCYNNLPKPFMAFLRTSASLSGSAPGKSLMDPLNPLYWNLNIIVWLFFYSCSLGNQGLWTQTINDIAVYVCTVLEEIVYIDGWSYRHGASSVGRHRWSLWGDIRVPWHGWRCCPVSSHGWVGRWCTGVSGHGLTGVSHRWSLSLWHGSSWLWVHAIWLLVRVGRIIPIRLRDGRVQPRSLGQHERGWGEPAHDWRGLPVLWFGEISMS